MVKVLARSIREFKKASILTPLLVSVEVILECAIPFVIAQLVNQMQAGCSMAVSYTHLDVYKRQASERVIRHNIPNIFFIIVYLT